MEKTPVSKSKFSYSKKNQENKNVNADEESPQISYTQESADSVDVVWDWNSPRVQQPKRCQKRLMLSHSPKPAFKRHPSNNAQDFEKLRLELQALKEEIAVPDNEDSLRLSPVEEAVFKNVDDEPEMFIEETIPSQEVDFFNDSLDDQLLMVSRKIESEIQNQKPSISNLQKPFENNMNTVNYSRISTSIEQAQAKLQQTNDNSVNISNDSFDSFIREFNTKPKCTKPVNEIKNSSFLRTRSDNFDKPDNHKGKVEFHRTQSFEMSRIDDSVVVPKDKLQEIERKRLEALAKLESKRKQDIVNTVPSPAKCSLDEIERKRSEALAKREAKRQQEFIERKRQEALKKLEIRRKKNATMVKSSLTNRLN